MKERNKYLESDGLYYTSETHEWFKDKITTNYARDNSNNEALDLYCFVVRELITGDYTRVILCGKTNQPIYNSNSLEDIGIYIDKLRIVNRFKE